jgi:hypothetical protein
MVATSKLPEPALIWQPPLASEPTYQYHHRVVALKEMVPVVVKVAALAKVWLYVLGADIQLPAPFQVPVVADDLMCPKLSAKRALAQVSILLAHGATSSACYRDVPHCSQ